jgi:hypothetical protein
VGEQTVAGGVLMLLGGVALVEARRLAALREEMVAGAVVGDDTFPWVIGAALVLLGGYILVRAGWRGSPVTFPVGRARGQMLATAGMLAVYYVITPYLGYTIGTLVASAGLYRAMGRYRWTTAIVIGGITTAALYLVFRVWLHEPLPTGWLGI